MNKFTQAIKNFWQDEEGLTVVEYVIGAGLLVIALAGLFATMGTQLQTKITTIISNIADGA